MLLHMRTLHTHTSTYILSFLISKYNQFSAYNFSCCGMQIKILNEKTRKRKKSLEFCNSTTGKLLVVIFFANIYILTYKLYTTKDSLILQYTLKCYKLLCLCMSMSCQRIFLLQINGYSCRSYKYYTKFLYLIVWVGLGLITFCSCVCVQG